MNEWYALYEDDCSLFGEAAAERQWFGPSPRYAIPPMRTVEETKALIDGVLGVSGMPVEGTEYHHARVGIITICETCARKYEGQGE